MQGHAAVGTSSRIINTIPLIDSGRSCAAGAEPARLDRSVSFRLDESVPQMEFTRLDGARVAEKERRC